MRHYALAALLTAALIPLTAIPTWADDDPEGGSFFHCHPSISVSFDRQHDRVVVRSEPDDRWYGIDVGTGPDADTAPDADAPPDATPVSSTGTTDSTGALTGQPRSADAKKKWWCRNIPGEVTVRNATTGETETYSVQAPHSDKRTFGRAVHGGDRITAEIQQGTGSDSDAVTVPATRPSPPRNLIATKITDTTATIDWTRPEFDGGARISGYRIWVDGQQQRPDSTPTSWLATELTPDALHTIAVAAVNEKGVSESTVVQVQTIPSPTAPGRPQALVAPSATTSMITLRWQAPANTGGRPITGYQVQANGRHVDVVTGTTIVIGKLDAGTLYNLDVRAVNDIGVGPPATLSAWTDMNPIPKPKAPGAPRDVTLTATSGTTMTVTWRAPASSGATPVSGYLVEMAGTTYDVPSGTSLIVSGLQAATKYEATVRAVNTMGPGAAATGSGWTPLVPVPKPVTRPSEPRSLRDTATTQTSVSLAWQKPEDEGGEPVSAYLLSWGEGRSAYIIGTTETVTGLEPGTRYTFELQAVNSAGTSDPVSVSAWTDMAPVPTPVAPSEPRDLAAPTVTKTAMLLTWNPPATDGGSPVTGYLVSWGPGSELLTPDTSALIEGLTPGTSHDVSVIARNAMGASAATTLSVWTVFDPVPEPVVPTEPRDLRALGATTSSVLLDWARPASDGGNPITGYAVFVDGVYYGLADRTSAAVSGLAADTQYAFAVRAVNAMGMSASASVTARTLAEPAPAPVPPRPRPDVITPTGPTGVVDVDRNPRTLPQTVTAAWPAKTTLLSGRSRVMEREANLVTNAGQRLKVKVTYRSPSIKSTRIVLNRRTGEYSLTAVLKPGKVSGAVILTATAPATKVGATRYERLQSSKRFTILDSAKRH